MKNDNIVCLREIVTYNENDDSEDDFFKNSGFAIGDVFMVFEFVDYDLSGLLKSPGFVLSDMQVSDFLFTQNNFNFDTYFNYSYR
jgi:hypothetical protein